MPKIRTYEADQTPENIRELIRRELGKQALQLSGRFIGVYEGNPPVPAEIDQRSIAVDVKHVWISKEGVIRASGHTEDGSGVSITIPTSNEDHVTFTTDDTERSPIISDAS